jgi:hypothetical protein
VLDSEPNPSLAKSPNARYTPIYTILQVFFCYQQEVSKRG